MDLVRYARSLRLLGGSLLGVAFPVVDADRAGRVANDIQAGTAHVEQTVDAVDEADVGRIDADGIKHHRQHDHARAGGTGGADGGERRGDDDGHHLAHGQVDADALGQEDRGTDRWRCRPC